MQQSTEYGRRQGHHHTTFPWPVAASEVFKKKGGAFVTIDTNGRIQIAVAGDVDIIGHAIFNEDFTASSTAGGTTVPVDLSFDSVYEVPINAGTWADTMRGKLVDLVVTSGIQGVDLAASGEDVIQLIDKGTTNSAGTVVSVLCRIHPRLAVPAGVV